MLPDALPLTPSGKADGRALPAPESARPELEQEFAAPRDPWERHLASLWQQLLGFGPLGVQDDFFELGGHSLLAARLFARIEQRWGRKLPLVALFQAPTARATGQSGTAWSLPGTVTLAAALNG